MMASQDAGQRCPALGKGLGRAPRIPAGAGILLLAGCCAGLGHGLPARQAPTALSTCSGDLAGRRLGIK